MSWPGTGIRGKDTRGESRGGARCLKKGDRLKNRRTDDGLISYERISRYREEKEDGCESRRMRDGRNRK
jgi:hypothetical protein